jgi:hypothetical protein
MQLHDVDEGLAADGTVDTYQCSSGISIHKQIHYVAAMHA